MSRSSRIAGALFVFGTLIAPKLWALDEKESVKLLQTIDERQRNSGDYYSDVLIEDWEKQKGDKDFRLVKAFQAQVYRRDEDDQLIILFVAPKSEAGKGYLRVDNTLLSYEPALGKWNRESERVAIGGTGSRRNDFDESRLACEYKPKYVGLEKLGKHSVHHLKLEVLTDAEVKERKKAGPDPACAEVYKNDRVEVGAPVLELWIAADTSNLMKREEFASSGRIMRRALYPSWVKRFSKSKGADVYVPETIYAYELLGLEKMTKVAISKTELDPLPKNIFTKAYIEKRSGG